MSKKQRDRAGLHAEPAPWTGLVLVCSKCLRRQDREELRGELRKALKQAGMEGSIGQWSASMVSALNVTVQNIVGQQAAPMAKPAPLAAISAPSEGLTMPEPAEAELVESDAERSAESVL